MNKPPSCVDFADDLPQSDQRIHSAQSWRVCDLWRLTQAGDVDGVVQCLQHPFSLTQLLEAMAQAIAHNHMPVCWVLHDLCEPGHILPMLAAHKDVDKALLAVVARNVYEQGGQKMAAKMMHVGPQWGQRKIAYALNKAILAKLPDNAAVLLPFCDTDMLDYNNTLEKAIAFGLRDLIPELVHVVGKNSVCAAVVAVAQHGNIGMLHVLAASSPYPVPVVAALDAALFSGHQEVVDFCLSKATDLELVAVASKQAAHWRWVDVEMLLSHVQTMENNVHTQHVLDAAVRDGRLNVVQTLLPHTSLKVGGSRSTHCPIDAAVRAGHWQVVAWLMEHMHLPQTPEQTSSAVQTPAELDDDMAVVHDVHFLQLCHLARSMMKQQQWEWVVDYCRIVRDRTPNNVANALCSYVLQAASWEYSLREATRMFFWQGIFALVHKPDDFLQPLLAANRGRAGLPLLMLYWSDLEHTWQAFAQKKLLAQSVQPINDSAAHKRKI